MRRNGVDIDEIGGYNHDEKEGSTGGIFTLKYIGPNLFFVRTIVAVATAKATSRATPTSMLRSLMGANLAGPRVRKHVLIARKGVQTLSSYNSSRESRAIVT